MPILLKDNLFYYFYKNMNFFSNDTIYTPSYSFFNFINFFSKNYFMFSKNLTILNIFINFFIFINLTFNSFFYSFFDLISQIFKTFVLIIFSTKTNFIFNYFYNFLFFKNNFSLFFINQTKQNYSSDYFNNTPISFINKYSNEETSNLSRYLKFYNPVFKYDFKSGDYFPKIYKETYTYLFMTRADALGSLRNAP